MRLILCALAIVTVALVALLPMPPAAVIAGNTIPPYTPAATPIYTPTPDPNACPEWCPPPITPYPTPTESVGPGTGPTMTPTPDPDSGWQPPGTLPGLPDEPYLHFLPIIHGAR